MWCHHMAAKGTGNHSGKICICLKCENKDSNDNILSTLANSSWSTLVPKGNAKEMNLLIQNSFPPPIFMTDMKTLENRPWQ